MDEARDEDDDRLTSVPAEVWGMGGSLTKMTVAGHAIASLPPQALKSLERLVLLDLSNNRLGGGGAYLAYRGRTDHSGGRCSRLGGRRFGRPCS